MGHRMMPIAFSHDRPPLPWQRTVGQNFGTGKMIMKTSKHEI